MSAMPPGATFPQRSQMVAGGRRAAAHLRNTTPARTTFLKGSQIDVRPRRGRRLISRFGSGGVRYAQTTGYLLGPLRGPWDSFREPI
ncbi:hypothetical protein Mal33_10630 [Rosistilla oblonga]|uniref:Uncharacterized protein n=1 Tax=Rosistilla oblonga TaxID=2527990 RepID=A0A518IPT7_9BACT|nr:hypothetical protein Mal33_10630 [Rosistilla oblonga]